MSQRLKAIEYISQEIDPFQHFIPYINERAKNGSLLSKSLIQRNRIIKQNHLGTPIKQVSYSQQKASTPIDQLSYLADRYDNNRLSTPQSLAFKQLLSLTRPPSQSFQVHQSSPFRTSIPIPEENRSIQYNQITRIREKLVQSNKFELKALNPNLGDKQEFQVLFTDFNNIIQKKGNSKSKRLRLTGKVEQPLKDFLDFSLDLIKPKNVVNIVFRKEKPSIVSQIVTDAKVGVKKKEDTELQQQPSEITNMYGKMIKKINQQEVTEECRANPHKLLRPQKEFTFKDIEGDFAGENQRKLQGQMQNIQMHRGNLKQLSERMEEIITYRRYGERDLDEDEMMREGKLRLV